MTLKELMMKLLFYLTKKVGYHFNTPTQHRKISINFYLKQYEKIKINENFEVDTPIFKRNFIHSTPPSMSGTNSSISQTITKTPREDNAFLVKDSYFVSEIVVI